MKILNNLLITFTSILFLALLAGIIDPSWSAHEDGNRILPVDIPADHLASDYDSRIEQILGASGGRYRIFSLASTIVRIDTASSRLAVLDTKKRAWINLHVEEQLASSSEKSKWIKFLVDNPF